MLSSVRNPSQIRRHLGAGVSQGSVGHDDRYVSYQDRRGFSEAPRFALPSAVTMAFDEASPHRWR